MQSLRQLRGASTDRPGRHQAAGAAHRRRPGVLTADKLVAEEAVEEGAIEAVRMVLSGVARAESRIACGKNLIAQMLCGSNSAKIKKLRLNQLSTFGLLWQLKQAEVVTLIDILIAIGCLEQEDVDRFRPVLKLTPLGGDVMRGKAELPAGLKLPGELRLKLRRPMAKERRDRRSPGARRESTRRRSGRMRRGRPRSPPQSPPPPPGPPKIVEPSGQTLHVADDGASRQSDMSSGGALDHRVDD